jgi:hypothetical protein
LYLRIVLQSFLNERSEFLDFIHDFSFLGPQWVIHSQGDHREKYPTMYEMFLTHFVLQTMKVPSIPSLRLKKKRVRKRGDQTIDLHPLDDVAE